MGEGKKQYFFPLVFVTKIQCKNLDFDRKVTSRSKMRANKKQIQKKVNRPKIVLFTLFIFVKKKKAAKFRAPFQKNFCLFLPFSEISVMGAISGAPGG